MAGPGRSGPSGEERGLVLIGPFLTRAEAARLAGVPRDQIAHRPDLVRIGGRWTEEVYLAWQFDQHGVRSDIGRVVTDLAGHCPGVVIADWMTRPNPELQEATPLAWLLAKRDPQAVARAAKRLLEAMH